MTPPVYTEKKNSFGLKIYPLYHEIRVNYLEIKPILIYSRVSNLPSS